MSTIMVAMEIECGVEIRFQGGERKGDKKGMGGQ